MRFSVAFVRANGKVSGVTRSFVNMGGHFLLLLRRVTVNLVGLGHIATDVQQGIRGLSANITRQLQNHGLLGLPRPIQMMATRPRMALEVGRIIVSYMRSGRSYLLQLLVNVYTFSVQISAFSDILYTSPMCTYLWADVVSVHLYACVSVHEFSQ